MRCNEGTHISTILCTFIVDIEVGRVARQNIVDKNYTFVPFTCKSWVENEKYYVFGCEITFNLKYWISEYPFSKQKLKPFLLKAQEPKSVLESSIPTGIKGLVFRNYGIM